MFVQLILTIGKARTFDKTLPPPFLGVFDFKKIAFVDYINIQDIFFSDFSMSAMRNKKFIVETSEDWIRCVVSFGAAALGEFFPLARSVYHISHALSGNRIHRFPIRQPRALRHVCNPSSFLAP